MREEQVRYCKKYVLPMIGEVRCRQLGRADLQRILNRARTASVARQLRRTVTGLVNAGLIEGHLLPRQDVLRGVRWLPADGAETTSEPSSRSISQDEIPTTDAVRALAHECAARSLVWWRGGHRPWRRSGGRRSGCLSPRGTRSGLCRAYRRSSLTLVRTDVAGERLRFNLNPVGVEGHMASDGVDRRVGSG
jgi:hypothetical protein